jgi:hypothetical protein
MIIEAWLLLTAIIFTFLGVWMGKRGAIEDTIDALIDQGYLRHEKKSDGEIEILKWNSLKENNQN